MAMVKRRTKHGNSHAIVIDKAILDLLEIDSDTEIALSTNGESLVLTPIRDPKRQKSISKALNKTHKKYGDVLQRLADS